MIKTLFQLFFAFAKIGFTSFGGTSMIPLIMEEMLSHNWMTADDVANIVAIAEMTPGSLGVNCATFAGTQTAGVLGGTAAVIGVLTPTLTRPLWRPSSSRNSGRARSCFISCGRSSPSAWA